MTSLPAALVIEPEAVAEWLDVDLEWLTHAVAHQGMPVLGYRSDGVPLFCTSEIRAWLRRPTIADDET